MKNPESKSEYREYQHAKRAENAVRRRYDAINDIQRRPRWWMHSITVSRAHILYPGLSVWTLRDMCADGTLTAAMFAGQWMIEEKSFRAFIATLPEQKELPL